jgi:hypothetical protein
MPSRETNRALRYILLLCPISGTIAALVATLVAVPFVRGMARKLADEVGVEAPGSVRFFLDNNLLLAGAAVVLGATAIFIVHVHPRRGARLVGSLVITALLFVPLVVLLIGFWSLYIAAIEAAASG